MHHHHNNNVRIPERVLRRDNTVWRNETLRKFLMQEHAASVLAEPEHQRVAVDCLLDEATRYDRCTLPENHAERSHLWAQLKDVALTTEEDDYQGTVAKLSSMMLWEDERRRYNFGYYEDELYARRINQLRTLQRLEQQAREGGDKNFLAPPPPKPQQLAARPFRMLPASPTLSSTAVCNGAGVATTTTTTLSSSPALSSTSASSFSSVATTSHNLVQQQQQQSPNNCGDGVSSSSLMMVMTPMKMPDAAATTATNIDDACNNGEDSDSSDSSSSCTKELALLATDSCATSPFSTAGSTTNKQQLQCAAAGNNNSFSLNLSNDVIIMASSSCQSAGLSPISNAEAPHLSGSFGDSSVGEVLAAVDVASAAQHQRSSASAATTMSAAPLFSPLSSNDDGARSVVATSATPPVAC